MFMMSACGAVVLMVYILIQWSMHPDVTREAVNSTWGIGPSTQIRPNPYDNTDRTKGLQNAADNTPGAKIPSTMPSETVTGNPNRTPDVDNDNVVMG